MENSLDNSWVTFHSADDGGQSMLSDDSYDYNCSGCMFSDNKIIMYLPSEVLVSGKQSTIGSGGVIVYNDILNSNNFNLITINHNYLQYISNSGAMKYRMKIGNINKPNNLTFNINLANLPPNATNTEIINVITRAMDEWSCNTGINIILDQTNDSPNEIQFETLDDNTGGMQTTQGTAFLNGSNLDSYWQGPINITIDRYKSL